MKDFTKIVKDSLSYFRIKLFLAWSLVMTFGLTTLAQNTVVDVVVNSADHTTLEAAVVAAGLAEALSGDGPFTVFAPTDAAFAALPAGTIEALVADPTGALTDILKYHVLAGKVMSTGLSNGMTASTLLGKDITVTINDDGVFINDAEVTIADIVTDNGVVHVIDAVILPPASVQIAENSAKGSILTDSRGKTLYFHARDAKDISNCTGGCLNNWPVFYDANLRLGEGLDTDDFGTIDRGAGVMQTTYKGWPLYYFVQDTKAGDVAGDGRAGVWFVAKPDYTIMLVNNQMVGFDGNNYKGDYTQGDEIIQYFTDAYGRTLYTYSSDFQNDNNFTYPDFKNNFIWPIYEMTDVVIPSILDASLFSITEVYGRKQLTYKGWPLYSFGADNMVRGSTKGVSLPVPGTWPVARQNMDAAFPSTVVDIVVASQVHTTLEAAVIAAGLVDALKGEGPFTVFAPTDAAFAALPAGTIEALLSDPSGLLTQILLYHVVGGNVLSTDLSDGMKATTLVGEDITVTFREDGVYIKDAKVIVADLKAGNGVVHVIDAVIMPPSSVQIAEHPAKGNILTDSRGKTLYFHARDSKDISNCTGGCLNNWPVFYDANLRVGEGLASTDFGTIDRGNGVLQTTYKGWPLYYFVQDTKAGDVAGDGRAGVWFVAKPDYTIMLVNNQLVGRDGNNYKGDYTQGDEIIQYFTDSYGRTLYTWSRDFYNTNKFTRADFSNNTTWAVYEEDGVVIPSVLDASLFSSINVHGRRQMTYKGWPLYYHGPDGTVRGSTKGVSVPMPGVWPVARQNMNAALPATVVDIVVASEDHSTLTAAVLAAGLAETLSGTGPFTVFAPTNAAFAALPEGTVEALLADIDALTNILMYHVAEGKVMSTDLSDGMKVKTIQGKNIVVTFREDGIYINEAKVTVADLVAGNGVVHVIDAVLIPEPPKTIVDVVVGSADHTTLEAAVVAAELAEALSGEGPFTLFAPTDAAFAALPSGTIEALLADPTGALADILKYHVLAGKKMSTDLSDGLTATTLLGKDITVTINDDGVFINGAKVTVADIEADNGVVHVIDAVLVPARVTVVDVIVKSEVHTTLEAAVVAAGLADALSGDGPFTVFAPTDEAFAALPAGTIEALLADPTGALADILKYHVLAGKVLSTGLSDGLTATTLLGKDITVTINADGVFINGAKVIVADIVTDNGVVHVIDAVLVPARITVVDVIVNSEVHTTLEAAVVAAGLVDALSGDGPFTVFAPTDAAFAALPAGTIEALLTDPTGALANILKYHVLAGKVMSTGLSNGMTATTLLGKDITVTINANGVFINGAKVIVADIETDNGVVHVVDAVLVPRTTVVDVIVNSNLHTTLEAAVVAAGLAEALSGDGPFTVFAPTDAAFAALPAGTIEALLADPTGALADILKYHVVAGKVMSGQLTNEQKVTTLSGKIFTVTINADGVFINKSKVIIADIETDNGVVHVIDAVLIADTPTNVADIFSGESRFGLYPNPASSNVTIDLSGTDLFTPSTISIVRADGKVISEFPVQDSVINYNAGSLNKGLYIVVLKQENRISTEKLIVR